MSAYPCPSCGAETRYQIFSGGREWYCPTCESDGSYPPVDEMDPEQVPRAMLLQTEAGQIALRAQMDQELARRSLLPVWTDSTGADRLHDYEHTEDGRDVHLDSCPCRGDPAGVPWGRVAQEGDG